MSAFTDLVERAKAQTQALRTTLNELATVEIDTPAHEVPEIARALGSLHAIKNGYVLTEVLEPSEADYMEGKIEGLDVAIEALEGRGATRTRGRKPTHKSSALFDPPTKKSAASPAAITPKEMPLDGDLTPGELTIFTAIAQCGKSGCTGSKLAVLTSYKRRSRETYLSSLRLAGLVEKRDDRHFMTSDGDAIIKRHGFKPLEKGAILKALGTGERAVFDAVAHAGDAGATLSMIAVATTYKRRSIESYLSSLRSRELVMTKDKRHHLTDAAREESKGSLPPKLTSAGLRSKWRGELPDGERRLFEVLEGSPGGLTKDEIGTATTYQRRSIETYLSKLSVRELVVRMGTVYKLSPHLYA